VIGDKNQVFHDPTGVILGNGQRAYVVQLLAFYLKPSCVIMKQWNAAVCPASSHVCTPVTSCHDDTDCKQTYARLNVQNLVAARSTYKTDTNGRKIIGLMVTRDDAAAGFPQQLLWGDPTDQDIHGEGWGVSLITGMRYILGFNQPTPAEIRLWFQFASQGIHELVSDIFDTL
jgi:hypothetical protein